jgi:hypothetical protein
LRSVTFSSAPVEYFMLKLLSTRCLTEDGGGEAAGSMFANLIPADYIVEQ